MSLLQLLGPLNYAILEDSVIKSVKESLANLKLGENGELQTSHPEEITLLKNYTDRCHVLCGGTKKYKDSLKELGLKYNSALSVGPGWIVPAAKYAELKPKLEALLAFKEKDYVQ